MVGRTNTGQPIAMTTATDYYPFGMPMPNRTLSGAEGYRYAYQGQEKDPETGKEAFELRLWDSRIGRWLTTDPANQHNSPYLGMGNNPIIAIDPDGARNIRFNEAGEYVGVDHDNWFHNLIFGNRGIYAQADGSNRYFNISSAEEDIQGIFDRGPGGTQIIEISNSKIQEIIATSGAFSKEARKNPISFALNEGSGLLDYASSLRDDYYAGADTAIFLPENSNVGHDRNNFGNFLTAASLSAAGIPFSSIIRLGAHYNALTQDGANGYPNQFDSSDDQYSLHVGFHFARNLGWNPSALSNNESNRRAGAYTGLGPINFN